MTTKVRIQNYQSIKDASLEIEGFTVIIGKNNIGKSAVIRALEAPLANQTGISFIRHGEKKTTVNIARDEIDIEWVKGASATYTVKVGEEKGVYTKLNRDVPQPLLDAGFGKMEVGDKKVFPFIAPQFDELFLVDKPGSVVTEVLASLYDIDVLSKADDLCQKAIRAQKSMLKTRETDLKTVEEKLEVFKDFEEIKENVADLVKKEEESENLRSEIFALRSYEEKVKEFTENLRVLKNITAIVIPDTKWFDKALNEVQLLEDMEERHKKLTASVGKLKGVSKLKIPKTKDTEALVKEVEILSGWDNEVKKLTYEIKAQKTFLDKFDINEITAGAEKVEKFIQEYSDTKSLEDSFSETVSKTKITRDELKEVTANLKSKKKEMSEIKVCPLCEKAL